MKIQTGKHFNLTYIPMEDEKQPSLGIFGILKEALKTTIRNGKIVVSFAFVMFTYYYLLNFADYFLLAPVYSSLASKYNTLALQPKDDNLGEVDLKLYQSLLKDVRPILVFKLITFALTSLILMTSLSAIIHSTHEAYTAKVTSFKDMFSSLRGKWKRPWITTFCVVGITFASMVLFLIAFGLIPLMTTNVSLSINLLFGLIIFVFCFYVYLSAVWILSLVVSLVEEENSSGMKAIDRARELMKGKGIQGFVLMLIFIVTSLIHYGIFDLLFNKNVRKSRLIQVAMSLSGVWLFCLKKLFSFVVFTMFYYECKRSHPVVEEEEKTGVYDYDPVSIDEV